MLVAESLDELDVLGFSTGLVEHAEMGLASVQGFGALAETSGETVVDLRASTATQRKQLDCLGFVNVA